MLQRIQVSRFVRRWLFIWKMCKLFSSLCILSGNFSVESWLPIFGNETSRPLPNKGNKWEDSPNNYWFCCLYDCSKISGETESLRYPNQNKFVDVFVNAHMFTNVYAFAYVHVFASNYIYVYAYFFYQLFLSIFSQILEVVVGWHWWCISSGTSKVHLFLLWGCIMGTDAQFNR